MLFIYTHIKLFFQIQINNKEINMKDSWLFFTLDVYFSNLPPLCPSNTQRIFYPDKVGKI